MSKVIKQMQMNALTSDFKDVREMVLLNIVGLDAIGENQVRLGLRKKGIRLQMVKNSLARRVFGDLGLQIQTGWEGSTTVAWGAGSVAELAKEIETVVKKYDKKMKVKTAVADGLEVAFDIALKMPTRQESLSRVAMLALAPARRIAAQIVGPASQVCGQIKGIKDSKKEEEAPAETPPA
ncbi:MAG: 50S ribosomal protein L10 [Planctomycetes bacterium]|nr:50S ribosomal protein L10 [Planctomycetota bacterium]